MQLENVPQDKGFLKTTRELCYAVDESGNYVQALSSGWEPKTVALAQVWDDLNERLEQIKEDIKAQKASPIQYFMEKKLMDMSVLAGYTGISKWRIKWHLKPSRFKKLEQKTLAKYANAFEIKIEELTEMALIN